MKLPIDIINYIYSFDNNQYYKEIHKKCLHELKQVLKYEYYEQEIRKESFIFISKDRKISNIEPYYDVEFETSNIFYPFLQYLFPFRSQFILIRKNVRIYKRIKKKKNNLLNLLYLF